MAAHSHLGILHRMQQNSYTMRYYDRPVHVDIILVRISKNYSHPIYSHVAPVGVIMIQASFIYAILLKATM